MPSYRIKYDRWANGPQGDPYRPVIVQPFRLRVSSFEGSHRFVFGVSHAEAPTGLRLDELERQYGEAEIQAAVIRWAVSRVESRLCNGPLPQAGTSSVEGLELGDADVAQIEQFAMLKTCNYQRSRGMELFCSAATPTDSTLIPSLGLAPTSRPKCRECDLPDSEYRCSYSDAPPCHRNSHHQRRESSPSWRLLRGWQAGDLGTVTVPRWRTRLLGVHS